MSAQPPNPGKRTVLHTIRHDVQAWYVMYPSVSGMKRPALDPPSILYPPREKDDA